ncbi:hypothetical protein HanHA300_Chr06g0205121 [Helianthus annuus]|nr:hypothetical protein HanHA300_Chr06g0205121 [Helianthus annuus]KAJ0572845.1 hypothetical protein HanHA89_Chr06g0220201 [Helianthus annuus]KAJ0737276.1 hypothetical protein HanLR1_Chr06g0205161 [Helianthus annuus]
MTSICCSEITPEGRRITKLDQILLNGNNIAIVSRAVNEPNVQRTVHESFGGKFVYVRSFS